MTKPPPESVKIGPHTVRIVVVPDGILGDAERSGHASLERGIIALDNECTFTQMADTLLHECVGHGVMASAGLEDEVEERVALVIGPGLLSFLRDNPELVKWVTQAP